MTGQLILRDGGTRGDKHIVMVVGLIGLTDEEFDQFKMEHQYTLTHDIALQNPVDVSAQTTGRDLGNLVCQPMWRV